MSVVDDIKSRLNIVDLVSETVKLRRAGKNYSGFCPFHANSRTPAFVVFPDSGTWRCFGQCNEGGDIFKFIMKKEGMDFPTALRELAQKAGVALEPFTPERKAEEEVHDRLVTLLEESVNFYRHQLLQSPIGQPALSYLRKRGLQPATLETFGLGFAPDSWDMCLKYFTGKGYTEDELLQVGLLTQKTEGHGLYDRFRNRIMFPIRDPNGRMAGFGARILDPDDIPKFLNSPQTVLFDKGRMLYGLDAARKAIRAQDQVVIVEGYLDVILLHQAGFTNTVSPMGTALTEDQFRLLKRFTRRMILALDADAAGAKATLRGLELARQALDHADELVFDARGLLRHEARLQADVRVTTIPEGMDPDEVVLRDPAEWGKIVANAQPIVVHVMETLAIGQNLDDPKTKGAIAAQVQPLIEDVPDPVERDAYRQRLARLLKVDERALLGSRSGAARPVKRNLRGPRPTLTATNPLEGTSGQVTLLQNLEAHALRLLIRQPEALYHLDRTLQKARLNRLGIEDFEHTDHQLLARCIFNALEQDDHDPDHHLADNLPESLQDLVEELRKPLSKGEPTAQQLLEDLAHTILRMRLVRVRENLSQIQQLQQDIQAEGDLNLQSYNELTLQYTQARDRLDRALGQPLQID